MAMHKQACACRLLLTLVCCAALRAAAIAAITGFCEGCVEPRL